MLQFHFVMFQIYFMSQIYFAMLQIQFKKIILIGWLNDTTHFKLFLLIDFTIKIMKTFELF